MRGIARLITTVIFTTICVAPAAVQAQSKPEYIFFPGVSKGALYRPDGGPAPHVGILVMHRTANYLHHLACTELSRRGFLMLCMNTRFENNESTITTETVRSVYVADPKLSQDNLRFSSGTKVFTLRSFLSANAVRAHDSMEDIEHCSSNNSTVCAVQSISVPVLFMAMGAHYFIRDNERHFDLARSQDKDFVVVEGAVHGFTPCAVCEKTAGQYSNTVKNLFDYAAKWLNDRF